MDEERLLNLNEAAHFLGKSEEDIKNLVEAGKLPAYQIGGVYLRFQLGQLQEFKNSLNTSTSIKKHNPLLLDNVRDFFYFNDFYILAILILIFFVFIIIKNIS